MSGIQFTTALQPGASDDGDAGRQKRGFAIAALSKIEEVSKGYRVPSQSSRRGVYYVDKNLEVPFCDCPDFELRRQPCKHFYAALVTVQREQGEDAVGVRAPDEDTVEVKELEVLEKPLDSRRKKKRNHKAEEKAQVFENEYFEILLWELCRTLEQPHYRYGRPQLPISDMVFCIVTKAQQKLSRRRVMTDIRRSHSEEFLDVTPHNSTITRYLTKADLTPVLKYLIVQSAKPLAAMETQFAIDSTGFSSTTYARWFDEKWGKRVRKAQWVKAHILCGVKTHIIPAVDISGPNNHDTNYLQGLLEQTAETFNVETLSADKAYLFSEHFEAVENRGGQLFVPAKIDTVLPNPDDPIVTAWDRALHYFRYRQPEWLNYYHTRSQSETVMDMLKERYGEKILSKDPVAQTNEVLARVLAHNIYILIREAHFLGIESEVLKWVSDAIGNIQSNERSLSLAP